MGRHQAPGRPRLGAGAELSRRGFLQAGALATAGVLGWLPGFRVGRASARATLAPPPAFPERIALYQQAYENWSGEIFIPDVWTAAPRTADEVVEIANWAHAAGWRVRPKGRSHNWSPLILPGAATGARCLLVDTTRHLARVEVDPDGTPATVTAGTGVTMDVLLERLGTLGLGFAATPAPGDVTLGGILAVDGHGAALPAEGEALLPGKTWGAIGNAVLALTAVVWDGGRYRLRRFRRDEPGIQALLTHVGRAFITEATLQVGADVNLRCRSFFDISADPSVTPAFQNLEMAAVGSGLILTGTWDIWGASRLSTLYVKPTTLRLAENGYALLTRRSDIQRVVSEYCACFRELVAQYQARGEYPMNGPIEIRATGLNRAGEALMPGALESQLSALRPRPDHPDWDCVIWVNALTFPGTPGENRFKAELEAWLLGNYTGDYAGVRVEWAKGWGYTERGAWTSAGVLGQVIPASLTAGQAPGDGWSAAVAALDRYDPGRIFSNPFLDGMLSR